MAADLEGHKVSSHSPKLSAHIVINEFGGEHTPF